MERFKKVDLFVENFFKIISYASGGISLLIALAVTINIIGTKLFRWSIPSCNDWVSYAFCCMFYFSISYVRLTQGLVAVDFFSQKYSPLMKDIVTIFSDLAGIVLYGLIGYYAIPLMNQNMKFHLKSSFAAGSFELWPFNAIVMLFSFFFTFTMIWHIVRLFVYKQHGERPREWSKNTPKDEGISSKEEK